MSKNKLNNILNRKLHYKEEVLALLDKKSKKIAYHFNCPDGIVSAALFKYLFSLEDLVFIPIDYGLLNDEEATTKFARTDWFAILDLEPFNNKKIKYFFDHHITNVDKEIKAEHFMFDSGAASAASLIVKFFENMLPEYLLELAKITQITDTASYKIGPPTSLQDTFEDLSWDQKVWFLQDACKSVFTVSDHNELVDALAVEGLKGIWINHILNKIGKLRKSRKISLEIVKLIEIKDFVVIVDRPVNFFIAFIAGEVMKRGAKGAAYITEYPENVKISLRLSKSLSTKKVNKFRVDLLAKSMGGGGHKPASGAETADLESALKHIETWAKKKKLKLSFIDLRRKEKRDYL